MSDEDDTMPIEAKDPPAETSSTLGLQGFYGLYEDVVGHRNVIVSNHDLKIHI
jgi:hypothetical protein